MAAKKQPGKKPPSEKLKAQAAKAAAASQAKRKQDQAKMTRAHFDDIIAREKINPDDLSRCSMEKVLFASKYAPEYCELYVLLSEQGRSIAQIAKAFNIAENTLYNWKESHPEFKSAMALGKLRRAAWYETQHQMAASGQIAGSSGRLSQAWLARNHRPDEYANPNEQVIRTPTDEEGDALTNAIAASARQAADLRASVPSKAEIAAKRDEDNALAAYTTSE